MEPSQATLIHKSSFKSGFEEGYGYILKVLNRVAEEETHLNPHVRKILNTTILTISETLAKELPRILGNI